MYLEWRRQHRDGMRVRSIEVTTHPGPQTTVNITTNDTKSNG